MIREVPQGRRCYSSGSRRVEDVLRIVRDRGPTNVRARFLGLVKGPTLGPAVERMR